MNKDPYDILGVAKTASADEIKKAYRRLANQHHPDKGGDAEKFKEINWAYQILSDDKKKEAFDRFGNADMAGGMGGAGGFGGGFQGGEDIFGGGFSDIFENFFSGGGMGGGRPQSRRSQRGEDIEMDMQLEFMEVVSGVEKTLKITKTFPCTDCTGSGVEKGSSIVTCDECQGSGQVRRVQQTILGSIATASPCPKCSGEGKIPEQKCHVCHGEGRVRRTEEVKVKIPAGVDNGMNIRMPGYGEAGRRGTPSGDLYLSISVRPDKRFQREGSDIVSEIFISVPQAVLGDTLPIETVYGEVSVKIPSGIQSGQVLKIRGKGLPKVNTTQIGDHLLSVHVEIPKHLSSREKEIYEQLRTEQSGGKKRSFF